MINGNGQAFITADGSSSICFSGTGITYHSRHGAIQESMHVFIKTGLETVAGKVADRDVYIFEMGFGTGLNALLTYREAVKRNLKIHYTAIESTPVDTSLIAQMNYAGILKEPGLDQVYSSIHEAAWNKPTEIYPLFILHKIKGDLLSFETKSAFDLIYYDAFAPSAQPELWTFEAMTKAASLLKTGGMLVTYCSKGEVRRTMKAAGFDVEKLPGPKGKREIVRAKR